jgi:excisionase family DNA binding protein
VKPQHPALSSGIRRLSRREPSTPITKTIEDTCRITGLGRTKVYELIAEGELRATAVGRRRLVFYASIEALLQREST